MCRAGSQHQILLSFWASITAEAVAGRLDLARSGRKEIQRQRQEDVLLKLLPLLKDGLSMHDSSEMVIACFTFAVILATKSQVTDNVLDSLMDAVTGTLNSETMDAGLVCLAILTQQKSDQTVPWKIAVKLGRVCELERRLKALNKVYGVEIFALGMIQSALVSMRPVDRNERVGFIERLLLAELMNPPKVILAISSLMAMLAGVDADAVSTSGEDPIARLLRRLNDSDKFSPLVAAAMRESGVDPTMVEAKLQVTIVEPEVAPADLDEMDVDSGNQGGAQNQLICTLEHLPQRTVDEHSFLSHSQSHLFQPLLNAFTLAAQSNHGLELFSQLPLWSSSADLEQPLYASFFIRVFSGPYAAQIRRAALIALRKWLYEFSDLDSQAILPYVLPQLADPVQSVRKAASELLLAMDHSFPSGLVDGDTCKQWGVKELYGSGKKDQPLTFVATKDVSKIIQRAVLPVLEECVLDPTQIQRVLGSALKPNSSNGRSNAKNPVELKKYLRQSFFRLILMHLLATPLYSVKLGLLTLISNIVRVGGIQKRRELMPLLLHWASLASDDVARLEVAEHLDRKYVSLAMCGIVSPADSDAVPTLLSLATTASTRRTDLVAAVSECIGRIWPQLETDRQVAAADSLLSLMFPDQGKQGDLSQISRDLFQCTELSTDVLVHLLDRLHTSGEGASEHSPVSKRRRTTGNQAAAVNMSASEAGLARIRKITFVLELVDSQNPESRPQLLSHIFHVLVFLHQLKLRHQSEMSYLLSLSLGSLLSIVRHAVLHASEIDLSAVRLDVIIECMRVTTNSQVQNTALLLIAAIAGIAPERVLDSIMPVFTFMGTNMVRKDDEYSSHVVDQTMDKVIPPLIDSLRSRGQDVIVETSDLVLSFTVAFEHIPQHRRLRLFKKLVSNLGDETFLAVLITSLTERYVDQTDVVSFVVSLVNTFDIRIQLKTCAKLVALVQDALAGQHGQPRSRTESEEANRSQSSAMVFPLLRTLGTILAEPNIRGNIARSSQSFKNETDSLMPFWKDLLERMVYMVQTPELSDVLSTTIHQALSSVLSLIPVLDLIDIAEYFVDVGPEIVKRKVLRLLESRLHTQHERSLAVQTRAIAFLQTLFRVLKGSEDEISKHAAIVCVDRICELYGRKDITAVIEAARVISSDVCLDSVDKKINTLALLCLTSIIGLVKDAIVPIVPHLMSKAFALLRSSLEEGSEDSELHDATFSLISALLAKVPFIVSEEYLEHILSLSAVSRNSELDSECHEMRAHSLQLIGKNIELGKIIGSLQRTWATTVENDVSAVRQALSLLADSVKTSSKSAVVKHADKLSNFLLQAFDLRRIQFTNRTEDSYTDSGVLEIEDHINSVAIEIIYKLNDTIFRPIFVSFVEWAIKCHNVKPSILPQAQKLRRTTLFNFLAHFFNTLKSIVTSYATYMVEQAIAVLQDISSTLTSNTSPKPLSKSPRHVPADQDTLFLYRSTLSALSAALVHDHDAHFSNPSLFSPLASSLVAQLYLASHPAYAACIFPSSSSSAGAVIPTIVALATAVVDTPDHLKTLNSLICGLRRAESARVRLASVTVQLALAGVREGQGAAAGGREREGEEKAGEGGDEEEQGAVGIADEWCATVLSVGQGMVYVNDMLEDEDEEVEWRARRLARRIKEVMGEEGEEGNF